MEAGAGPAVAAIDYPVPHGDPRHHAARACREVRMRGVTRVMVRVMGRIAGIAGLLFIMGWAGIVEAQVNDARIQVVVTDDQQQVLPGVTVTVTRPETGAERFTTTGVEGTASIPALAPGTYAVRFELEGFTPLLEENVVLRVGQTARLNATMRQQQTSEHITVTAEAAVVDIYKTDSSTNIVPEQIESLPVPDRDFQRLAFIAPGVQRERGDFRFIGGGPVIGSSGNASQSAIIVDGVDFTDPALGLARTRFSQDAIREFRVINNRFDAEIGQSAGGAMSIVTRSGTNDLSGTVFGFFRADELRSKGELEKENLPYSRRQYGFTLGGPIVKDRTHFFVSFEQINENNIALFRPGGVYKTGAADIEHPFDQTLALVSLDHAINDTQNLSAKLVFERYREENFRVGGVQDLTYGQDLRRDNWNLTLSHNLILSSGILNSLHFQVGSRKYFEPTNSEAVSEWFSNGTTLRTGANILGDLLGKGTQFEIRDSVLFDHGQHHWKTGLSLQHINDISRIDTYEKGLFLYATDDRSIPIVYLYGIGSSEVEKATTLIGAFVQDDWRPRPNLNLSLGLRYDIDTGGNNPGFTHPLVPNGRKRDTNNIQPRVSFSYDLKGDGRIVARGGYGRYAGRYLLIPAFLELQSNGITGRMLYTRLNGMILGLPQSYWLDPANPTTTGIPLKPAITLIDDTLNAPQADQVSVGTTFRLGSTNMFLDVEGIYVRGDEEIVIRDVNWNGNATPGRPNKTYDQINTFTNEGHSAYKALVMSLNGTIPGGHMLTTSMTIADKKNVSDDFSPEFPFGYPNDPANIEAEYGRGRGDERFRMVVTGIFHLPMQLTVAPIFEYGSGQPWNHRLGYDYNGDGKNSDRPAGVGRNSEDGPSFKQVSVRVTRGFQFGGGNRIDGIFEVFNLLNTVNYSVSSVDAAEFLAGPTLANPTAPYKPNPNFGKYSATFPGREIQLGVRWSF